jgi:ParB family protein of integrating conjugative element (PFGI_1 class)
MKNEPKKKSSLFAPHFGKPGNVPPPGDPVQITTMEVDVDRISFFAGNPRRSANDKYEEIKESIRESGLDNALPISRHPDDPVGHYIIYKGGNTRLKALKALWEETKDQRFLKIRCEFHPFISDTDALIAHLRENDLRGGMTFIDRALAVQDAKARFEEEVGETLSLRKLEATFKQRGFPISNGMLSKLDYAAKLNVFIPTALKSGVGKLQIERLQKLENAALAVLRFHGDKYATEQQFRDTVFAPALSGGDGESWVYEAAEAAVRLRLLAALPQGTDSESVFASFKLAINGKELAKTPEPPVTHSQAEPELAPAYPPLDQLDLLDTPVAVPAPVMGRGGIPMDGVYVQPPQPIPLPSTDGEIRIEGGGMPLEGGLDDDGLEEWMPYASQTRETVIEGNGRWTDRIKGWRERNHALAVKLSNACVPHGELSIEQLNVGYGFIFHNVYNPNYLLQLNDRADVDTEAVDAIMHIANLWWFLAEASGMFPDPDYPQITCPPDVLSQHVPDDSHLYNQKAMEGFAPVPIASVRLRTWWLKLTDKQLEMVFELVRNIRAINDALLEHAKETGNASAWEITTE